MLLIVGEAPGYKATSPSAVFEGLVGARLDASLGCDWRRIAIGVNLLGVEQPRQSGGSAFDARAARAAACAMVRTLRAADFRVSGVLLLGRRVATAFGVGRDVPYLEEFSTGDFFRGQSTGLRTPADMHYVIAPARVVPHPSGRCRWWNAAANVRHARAVLQRVADAELDRQGQ